MPHSHNTICISILGAKNRPQVVPLWIKRNLLSTPQNLGAREIQCKSLFPGPLWNIQITRQIEKWRYYRGDTKPERWPIEYRLFFLSFPYRLQHGYEGYSVLRPHFFENLMSAQLMRTDIKKVDTEERPKSGDKAQWSPLVPCKSQYCLLGARLRAFRVSAELEGLWASWKKLDIK